MSVLVAPSLLCIFLTSFYLVLELTYDDGILGRIALSVMAIAGAMGTILYASGEIVFNPVSKCLIPAVALLQLQKAWRVYRKTLRPKTNENWRNGPRFIEAPRTTKTKGL